MNNRKQGYAKEYSWLCKTKEVLMQSADMHNCFITFPIIIYSLRVKPWLLSAAVNVASSQNWKQFFQPEKQIDD